MMSIFSFLKKKESTEEINRFVELINDNNKLTEEINVLYRALRECGCELYQFTGNVNAIDPQYYINIVKKKYYGDK